LPNGTIIGRKIISFPIEEDQIGHKLNKIKKAKQDGARSTPRLWEYANNVNKNMSNKTAQAIVELANLYCSDVIVFEHLDMQGKKKGSKRQRLHMWRKKAIIRNGHGKGAFARNENINSMRMEHKQVGLRWKRRGYSPQR
jgi:hypothetical protein